MIDNQDFIVGIFQHMLAHLCLIQVVVRESMLQMQFRTVDKGDIRKILLQRICRPVKDAVAR